MSNFLVHRTTKTLSELRRWASTKKIAAIGDHEIELKQTPRCWRVMRT